MKVLLVLFFSLGSHFIFPQENVLHHQYEHSGGSAGSGGSGDESQIVVNEVLIKESLLRIKDFFQKYGDKKEVKNDFPMINIDKLSDKIDEALLKLVITEDEVYDFAGVSRFAVNYEHNGEIHYNIRKMRSIKSAAVFYVLQTHEIFGLLGIEKNDPSNEVMIENYPHASKIAKYVVKVLSYGLDIVSDINSISKQQSFICRNLEELKPAELWLNIDNRTKNLEVIFDPKTETHNFYYPLLDRSYSQLSLLPDNQVVSFDNIGKFDDDAGYTIIYENKSLQVWANAINVIDYNETVNKFFNIALFNHLDIESGADSMQYSCRPIISKIAKGASHTDWDFRHAKPIESNKGRE